MTNKIICYHHNDLDGYAAGWQVHLNEPGAMAENFITKTYTDAFCTHHIGKIVYIVDLSFTEQTLHDLISICEEAYKVIWIDHHKSSINVIEKYKDELSKYNNLIYFVYEGISGCALTYMYFYIINTFGNEYFKESYKIKIDFDFRTANITHHNMAISISLPVYLAYISDYDCWIKSNANTDYFINGCNLYYHGVTIYDGHDTKFNTQFWHDIKYKKDKFIEQGETIALYLKARYSTELAIGSYESEYKGNKILCLNSRGNSLNFGDMIELYPMVVLFRYEGKYAMFSYSLYASSKNLNRLNCNEIAEEFGGGGHSCAAGFSSDKMVFKPII